MNIRHPSSLWCWASPGLDCIIPLSTGSLVITGQLVSFHFDISKSECLKFIVRRTVAAPLQIEPVHPDITTVPSCYHNLREVFSNAKTTSLPPHRVWFWASPLRSRLYSLSALETQAIREYIQSSLDAGIIRPSSSLAGAGFFSKARTLWPCIHYQVLNNITVQNRYPLPLISSAFEQLQQARFLRNWISETPNT